MNPMSVDIKDLLVREQGDFWTFSQNLFIGLEPDDSNDSIVTIYDTGFAEQNPKLAIDENTLQFRSRANEYTTSWNKLDRIKLLIEGKEETIINGSKYLGFWFGNIMFLNRDGNNRIICVVNARMIREPDISEVGNRQL